MSAFAERVGALTEMRAHHPEAVADAAARRARRASLPRSCSGSASVSVATR